MTELNWLDSNDVNKGVEEYKKAAGAYLLDVRSPGEYMLGHIPESHNIPLTELEEIELLTENKKAPLFVYCLSGSRSRQAAGILKALGYKNVKNIGGISAYCGTVVK
ncbi:MAG: rhodanese-like domain-containing protein [Clostridia bacterium]|nr:rhodanese-like domain-containing protein [Clostridia bacterium]MBQ5771239.1 rhodanese-like domain-containing protein [Clostridia bacterium]